MRAVSGMVKQLSVWMIQMLLSASSCIWTCIVMEKHYTGCQHSMTSFWMILSSFLLCFAIHLWRYCCSLLHRFHHEHSFSIP
jgi:uncharacterized membrane protein